MNKNELFRCIGDIADDLVAEAAHSGKRAARLRRSTVFALAAAILVLLGASVFAASAGIVSRSGHSHNTADYDCVPTRRMLRRDVGIELNVPEGFSTGYQFQSGNIVDWQAQDEDGAVQEQYRGLACVYTCAGDMVNLHVDGAAAGNQLDRVAAAETYRGCALKYYTYDNKLVPGDYQLNEQDRQDEESGKYVFSYGSEGVELHRVQGLGFEYGGLNYTLCAIDSSVTKDQLLQMAKELIDNQD